MSGMLVFVHALSPLHIGSGASLNDLDLPVWRDRRTGWPRIAGTSLKGALRASTRASSQPWWQAAFGSDGAESAVADLSVGDGALLSLPVRAAQGWWVWLVCPESLGRFFRDAERAGVSCTDAGVSPMRGPGDDEAWVAAGVAGVGPRRDVCVFEESAFRRVECPQVSKLATWLAARFTGHEATRRLFEAGLAMVSDTAFTHFAHAATVSVTRNALDYETKTVKPHLLFREEFVLPETVFVSPVTCSARGRRRASTALADFKGFLRRTEEHGPRELRTLQLGGGESTGYGLCALAVGA